MSRRSASTVVLGLALAATVPPSSFAQELDRRMFDALRGPSLFPGEPAIAAAPAPGSIPGAALGAADEPERRGSEPEEAAGSEPASASGGRRLFADDEEGYEGGRGLITLEGISGMFLNPTSGTLPARSLTAQYCVGILERNE